jgi:NitT/TauT family transport system substrate-binding protein/sulfonate transport system substrate-binding protein
VKSVGVINQQPLTLERNWKMKKFALLALILALMTVFSFTPVFGQNLVKLKTCWMPEFETFFPWLAHQRGWDKEEGLDLELVFFDSGMAEMEGLPAKQWVLGGTGGVPMVIGALRYDAYEVGLASDDAITNNVYVRPDSPILKTKGFNKDYPDVYGSPESVKGKTILVTTVSSVHYAMSSWLKVLGLKDSDVKIQQMDQSSIVAAFDKGIGDVAMLWAPYCYTAAQKGWKRVANLKTCGVSLPVALICDKEFGDQHPDIVAKFLHVYLRGVNYIKKYGSNPEVVKQYQKFMKDWGGMNMTPEICKLDIDSNPVWTLKEQLELLDSSKGQSTAQRWQQGIAEFFTAQGRIKPDEFAQVSKKDYVTDKFLKMVNPSFPDDPL